MRIGALCIFSTAVDCREVYNGLAAVCGVRVRILLLYFRCVVFSS
nr:MAG TPA: hypothetical protein [Caudoviricetes sp.]